MVYLCIVFDIATTLCALCCRSVGSDRSHSLLSASLPTATSSIHLPPPLNFVEFRESATTASAEYFMSTSLPSMVVSLSELICIHYICIAAMLIQFVQYIYYFEWKIVINVVDVLSVTLLMIVINNCNHYWSAHLSLYSLGWRLHVDIASKHKSEWVDVYITFV